MSWSAQRPYKPPEGPAYAGGIETPALRLFLQRFPFSDLQERFPTPCDRLLAIRVGGIPYRLLFRLSERNFDIFVSPILWRFGWTPHNHSNK